RKDGRRQGDRRGGDPRQLDRRRRDARAAAGRRARDPERHAALVQAGAGPDRLLRREGPLAGVAMNARLTLALVLGLSAAARARDAVPAPGDPKGPPAAPLALATTEGAAAAKAQWRYADARLVDVDFKAAGPEGQPTGATVRTHEIEPHAGGIDFDDSG